MSSLGSSNLSFAIETERTRLHGLQDFVDKDFNQWADLLAVSVPTNVWIHLTQPARSNNQFSLQANGTDGFNYSLWRRPDVATGSWEEVTNAQVGLTGFTLFLTDPESAGPRRYYQVRAEPLAPMLLSPSVQTNR